MCKKLFLTSFCLLIISVNLSAQVSTKEQELKAEEDRVMGRTADPLTGRKPSSQTPTDVINVKTKTKTIQASAKEIERQRKIELFKKAQNKIKPSTEYYKKFNKFLNQKNTGLGRIFQDKNCTVSFSTLVISVKDIERCIDVPAIPGDGSYYSFRKETNYSLTNGEIDAPDSTGWWDIHLIKGDFVVGNCCAQGIIAEIGNIAIESIDSNSVPLKYLQNYQARKTAKAVQEQNALFLQGVKAEGVVYSRKAPLRINSSYVLRSIEYKNENRHSDVLKEKSDITVVFKVVGQEEDGSVILLWKKL